jgi:hypothetical protein
MCWNQYVSINTFVFGVFVLLIIAFNQSYSNYKIDFFKNKYAYFFLFTVILMQFFEFILWRNLDNKSINKFISILGILLLALQPFASLLLLNNIHLRNNLLITYSIPAIIFLVYNYSSTNIYTKVSKYGHLSWHWTNYDKKFDIIVKMFYLFFLFFSLFYNKYYKSIVLLLAFFIINFYYYKDGTDGSIWCFFVNIVMLYFLIQLLIQLPIEEIINSKKKIDINFIY